MPGVGITSDFRINPWLNAFEDDHDDDSESMPKKTSINSESTPKKTSIRQKKYLIWNV